MAAFAATLWAQSPEFVCPMDPEVRAKGPGKCVKCGMLLVAGIREQIEYPLDLEATPRHAPAGRKLRLVFRVKDPRTGKPVENFEVVHEKLFHLFVVGDDLQYFAHEHPAPASGGEFVLETELPKPGTYRLLADFYPAGGTPQLIPKTLTTAGWTRPIAAARLTPDLAPKRTENLEVELRMEPAQPIAGKKTLLFFRLKPSDGLEPYLGAWGHMLIASHDLIDTLHAHPSIAEGGPELQFDVIFPRAADYRIWVQFQRAGRVNTAAFTVPAAALK